MSSESFTQEIRSLVTEIMPEAMKLCVPLKIDVGLGRNWGEMGLTGTQCSDKMLEAIQSLLDRMKLMGDNRSAVMHGLYDIAGGENDG